MHPLLPLFLAALAQTAPPEFPARVYFKVAAAGPGAGVPVALNVAGAAVPLRLPAAAQSRPEFAGLYQVRVSGDAAARELAQRLATTPGVEWVEAAPVRRTGGWGVTGPTGADFPPNDPYLPFQWALERISAEAAWDLTTGDTSVVVAIVDVGVDFTHPELQSRRWVNRAEQSGRAGADDDGNGFVDDLYGWDFFDDDADPAPRERDFHGTHIAGIVGAAADNGLGVAGVDWNCRLMNLRAGAGGFITNGFEAIIYAVMNGADVVNLSWGGAAPSHLERIATEFAAERGTLLVAAAGNLEGGDASVHYPAAYDAVLSVAATDARDRLASFSKSGDWVKLCAPGENILSTLPGGGYGVQSGTSMAAPLAAGAAALIRSLHPDWTAPQVLWQLLLSADRVDSLNPAHAREMGYGRLNLYRAVAEVQAAFDLVALVWDDRTLGNGNGLIDPGENLRLKVTVENLLQTPAELSGRLDSEDPRLRFLTREGRFGRVEPGGQAECQQPFEVRIADAATPGTTLKCRLTLFGPDVDEHRLNFELVVRSPYATHSNGQVALTVTDFGALGYYDYPAEESRGEGFRYPRDGLSALFHGSLMLGAAGGRVSDNAYGNADLSRFDFVAASPGMRLRSWGEDGLRGDAAFTDARAESPLQIRVLQSSFSFSTPADDNYVVISYLLENESPQPYDSLYVGLFLDWDVVQADRNLVHWLPDEEVGWVEYPHPGFGGFAAALLDRPATFQAAVETRLMGAWNDVAKFERMTAGFAEAEGDRPADWAQVMGTGPLTLAAGDTVRVTFALAGAASPEQLVQAVQAARRRWSGAAVPPRFVPPSAPFVSVFPQPFNGAVNVTLRTGLPDEVLWRVCDLTGRTVGSGGGSIPVEGVFRLRLDLTACSAGSYLLIVSQAGRQEAVPLRLVK